MPRLDALDRVFDAFMDAVHDAGGDVETGGGTLNMTEADYRTDMDRRYPPEEAE